MIAMAAINMESIPTRSKRFDVKCTKPALSTMALSLKIKYSAELSKTPLIKALIGVGDCECASGSQECIGANPAFVPKPTKKKAKDIFKSDGSKCEEIFMIFIQFKEFIPSPKV